MINLRYHIVSITAVFLALGVGLAFGSSFIEQATLGQLEANLDDIEGQNDDLEATNDELSSQLAAAATVEVGLRELGLDQLVDDRLTGVPVLVLAPAGISGDVVEAIEATVLAAGAEMAGVLRVTDRFALDDPSELTDLRTVLGLPEADASELRMTTTERVAALLAEASSPAPPSDASGAVVEVTPVPMPPLVEQLLGAGFLELDAVDEPPTGFALLPEHGLRTVVVSGPDLDITDDAFLTLLLRELLAENPTDPDAPAPPIVAVQPSVPAADQDEPEVDLLPFLGPLRADEALRSRLSTVDHIDSFAGLVALVLALEHVPAGQFGHYGVGDGAQALLPAGVGG